MNNLTDWLMVWITAVYVIATVFICVFNGKSASAAKKQTTEMIAQHNQNRRMTIMPFLQIENCPSGIAVHSVILPVLYEYNKAYILQRTAVRLRNLGNGTATNIGFTWKCTEEDRIIVTDYPTFNAIKDGDEYIVELLFKKPSDSVNSLPFKKFLLEINFDDMLGYSYTQKFYFDFNSYEHRNNLENVNCESNPPEWCDE